jgi:nucleolar GTP-binding protein
MKKAQKNKARLPRTASLRTLSELSAETTRAGLNPSKIEEREKLLVKMQIAKEHVTNRKRGEEDGDDMGMDRNGYSEDEGIWEDEDRSMDVDEDEEVPRKKKKPEAGAIVLPNKRVPVNNRQLSGFKDMDVRTPSPIRHYSSGTGGSLSKLQRRRC